VRRWDGWIEQRVRTPYLVNVIDAEVGMFEQMRGLVVDLERILVIEQIDVEQLGRTKLKCNTNEYVAGDEPLRGRVGFRVE
jgi:hypothetical protein